VVDLLFSVTKMADGGAGGGARVSFKVSRLKFTGMTRD
jgi:hypothetical protein